MTLCTALAVFLAGTIVCQPRSAEAAVKTKAGSYIRFATTATMKGKAYTEENLLLNTVTEITAYRGQKITLIPACVRYQGGQLFDSGKDCVSFRTLKCSSSRPGVAAVSKNGVITPKKKGTASITVSSIYDSAVKGVIKVIVTTKAKAVKAAKKASGKAGFVLEASHQRTIDSAWMYPGEYMTLGIKYAKNMKNKELKWKSSDKSIAAVSKKGVVTAGKSGNVTITAISAADKSVKASFKIEVRKAPDTEELEKEYLSPDRRYRKSPGMLYYRVESRKNDPVIVNDADCDKTGHCKIHLYRNVYQDGSLYVETHGGKELPDDAVWDEKANFNVAHIYGASSQEVIYTNSNPEVGELDEDNVFVPKRPGTTVITVESAVNKKLKDTITVTVENF